MNQTNRKFLGFVVLFSLAVLGMAGTSGCRQWLRVGFKSEAPLDEGSGAQSRTRKRRVTSGVELRGVWVTNVDSNVMDSFGNMESLAARVSQLNMNALYPVVWNRGETFYPSDVMVRYGAPKISVRYNLPQQGRDPMADWLTLGNQYDLDIIPWFEWGVKVPANSPLAAKHPEWLSKDETGKSSFDQDGVPTSYLNFVNPEVQKFFEELVVEFVRKYEVPLIQFDDHLSLKNNFGYDEWTLDLYKKETGRAQRPAPSAPEWLRWRAEKLTGFVQRLSRAIKEARPGVRFSISPNPYPWSYDNYVQDWPSWVESGAVDEVVVQVYRDNMNNFQNELKKPELTRLKGKANIAIGVLSGLRPKPMPIDMVRQQTTMARDLGYNGVVYFFQESLLKFTAGGETIDSRIQVIKQMFPSPTRTP
jgi:uncharacterized lipoprotein YddW (UPF0748 family)